MTHSVTGHQRFVQCPNELWLECEVTRCYASPHYCKVWGPNINLFRDPRCIDKRGIFAQPITGGVEVKRHTASARTCLDRWPLPLFEACKMKVLARSTLSLQQQPNILMVTWGTILTGLMQREAYDVDRMPPRLSFDPNISETDLRQTFFPAFESAIRGGNVRSIMWSVCS